MTKTNTTLIDSLSLAFSLGVLAFVAAWTLHGGFLTRLVDDSMIWQLIRSSGLTAYILFTLSTLWGLALSSKIVKDWSPGTLSLLLHSGVSWLGVGFALIHAGLLLFDEYVSYSLLDILIPFMGEYRPFVVGLGTLTFWLMVLVTMSFAFKKRLGHKRWKSLHYASYGGFFMVTAHAYLAGTDADKIGFQILLGVAMLVVLTLTGYRIGAAKKPKKAHA